MEIALVSRATPDRRCAYCHDRLASADPCGGCGAVFHPECVAYHGRCPTLGCGRRVPLAIPGLPRPIALVAVPLELVSSLALIVSAGAMALSFVGLWAGDHDSGPAFVGGAAFVAASVLALTILWRWQGRTSDAPPLARTTLLAGIAGIAISCWWTLTATYDIDVVSGHSGIAAGLVLVVGGLAALFVGRESPTLLGRDERR